MKKWSGESCTVEATSELEATIAGRSTDSTVCNILDSIFTFFENSESIEGVTSSSLVGSSNDNCSDAFFNQSNAIGSQRIDNGSKAGWWVIMLIVVVVSLVLFCFTCCIVIRRRQRNIGGLEEYDEVKTDEVKTDEVKMDETPVKEDIISFPIINFSRNGEGSEAYSTVELNRCTSTFSGSNETESSDELIRDENYEHTTLDVQRSPSALSHSSETESVDELIQTEADHNEKMKYGRF